MVFAFNHSSHSISQIIRQLPTRNR